MAQTPVSNTKPATPWPSRNPSDPVVLTVLETDAEPASTTGSLPEAAPDLSPSGQAPWRQPVRHVPAACPNVAWTNEGAVDLEELPERQLVARLNGKLLEVNSVDKFPKMTDYVVPAGGSHRRYRPRTPWAPMWAKAPPSCTKASSTLMLAPEGPGMIEGRISAGCIRRQGLRHRWRRIHHGHPVRWW